MYMIICQNFVDFLFNFHDFNFLIVFRNFVTKIVDLLLFEKIACASSSSDVADFIHSMVGSIYHCPVEKNKYQQNFPVHREMRNLVQNRNIFVRI